MDKCLSGLVFQSFMALVFVGCSSVEIKEKVYQPNQIEVEIYTDKPASEMTDMVIVLPPTGGATYLENYYAKALAKRGFYVVKVLGWERPNNYDLDLNIHRKLLTKAHNVVETIVKEENSFQSYSLLGTSLGGIHSSISLGQIDKIKTAVIITAGAPVSEVIANSTESGLSKIREKRFADLNLKNMEEYEEALRHTGIPNALDYEESLKKKNVFLVMALKDKSVPIKNQEMLLKAIEPKKVLKYNSGHFWTIVKTWLFNSDEVISFIDENR